MQPRDGLLSSELTVSNDRESDDSRMWYVRLRIRDDRLAKIWAWNLAEHDAIVWSDSEDRWKQLLAVPELRAAVRKETTSAFVRQRTTSDAPPPMAASKVPALVDIESEEIPTQAQRQAERSSSPQEDNEPTRVRLYVPNSRVPAPVDPFLQALTTSIPPAVITNPAPEIPRAPKLPTFETEQVVQKSTVQAAAQSGVAGWERVRRRSRWIRSFESFRANATVKNMGWALLPVLGAAVFAVALNRSAESSSSARYASSPTPADGTYLDWLVEKNQLAQTLATKLVGAAPVCSGAVSTPAAPGILAPEQLAPVTESEHGSARVSRWRASPAGGAARSRAPEKASNLTGKAGVSASAVSAAGSSDFDRDAARTALRFAIARAKNCSNAGVSGTAMVTFASSGTVQGVQILQLVGDDVDPSCVSRAFSVSRVPPFVGSAVTVRKNF